MNRSTSSYLRLVGGIVCGLTLAACTESDPGLQNESFLPDPSAAEQQGVVPCDPEPSDPEPDKPDAGPTNPTGPTNPSSARAACILPLGDSITQSDAKRMSYRYWLWTKLRALGKPFDFVGSLNTGWDGTPTYPVAAFDRDHEGHFGWRTDQVRDQLASWTAAYPVGIALVHLGTNDVMQHQPIDGTIAELGEIIDILRKKNPDVAILLAQVIPTTYYENDDLTTLNRQIPKLVQQKSTARSPVILVDQNTGFDRQADTFDGIHPSDSGDKKMAERWFSALEPLLRSARPCP